MKKTALSLIAVAALLSGFFMTYDREAEQAKEHARIEAMQSTTEYQQTYARQLARYGW